MEIWVDNGNVARSLGERLGVEGADAVWAVAEGWFGNDLEEGDNLEAQLGEGSGGGLCEAFGLLLERVQSNARATGPEGMLTRGQQGGRRVSIGVAMSE